MVVDYTKQGLLRVFLMLCCRFEGRHHVQKFLELIFLIYLNNTFDHKKHFCPTQIFVSQLFFFFVIYFKMYQGLLLHPVFIFHYSFCEYLYFRYLISILRHYLCSSSYKFLYKLLEQFRYSMHQ